LTNTLKKVERPNYYISCPISVDQKFIDDCSATLYGMGAQPISWERGTPYDHQEDIDTCDGFVLILPENKFSMEVDDLPVGCRRELARAQKALRPICLSYKVMNGESKIFSSNINNPGRSGSGGFYAGRAGSQHLIKEMIQEQFELKNKKTYLQGVSANFANATKACDFSGVIDSGYKGLKIPSLLDKSLDEIIANRTTPQEFPTHFILVDGASIYDRRLLLV